jgi:hypothetical protein
VADQDVALGLLDALPLDQAAERFVVRKIEAVLVRADDLFDHRRSDERKKVKMDRAETVP